MTEEQSITHHSAKDITRFWSKVDKETSTDGCWLWTGKRYPKGYGAFFLKIASKKSHVLAHRFAYEIQYGQIPEGLHVLHIPPCSNKHCVRHLYVGTRQQNMQDTLSMGTFATGDRNGARIHRDKMRRGNQHGLRLHPEAVAKGEDVGTAKLTVPQVEAIRVLIASHTLLQREIGAMHGVSQTTISKIKRKERWKHL